MYYLGRNEIPRVALVAPEVAREGITKQVANQIVLLQQDGVAVFLLVLTSYNEKIMAELGVRLPKENVLQLSQPTPYLSPKALLESYVPAKLILSFLRRNNITQVVAHAPYSHFVMRLVKLRSYIGRYTFSLHQYFHELQYEQFPVNSFPRFVVNKLNQTLALLFDDSHIYISKAVKDDVEKNLIRIRKQQVLYNPIDAPPLTANSEKLNALLAAYREAYMIVLPGRLERRKGQLFFVDVFRQFLRQQDVKVGEIVLYIIGAGESLDELRGLTAASGLEAFVRLTGELPNSELRHLLSHAHLVVVPSFIEPLSFVALESLAAGKTLLASDAGGLKEVVTDGKTGFTFKAGDAGDCLAKLTYIYQNRARKLIDVTEVERDLRLRFSHEQYKKHFLGHLFSVGVR